MSETKEVTISISGVPQNMLADLDEIARVERRPRSGQIVKMIEEALAERRAAKPARKSTQPKTKAA